VLFAACKRLLAPYCQLKSAGAYLVLTEKAKT